MYVTGFERGVRPIGDWSTRMTSSIRSAPFISLKNPTCGVPLAAFLFEPGVQDVVNQRRFSRTGNAGYANEHVERYRYRQVFEIVFAGADDLDLSLCRSSRRFCGIFISDSPRRYLAVSDVAFFSSLRNRLSKQHCRQARRR